MAKKAKKKKARTKLTVITTEQDFQNALEAMDRAMKKLRVLPRRKKK